MHSGIEFQGILPALVTPLDEEGRFVPSAMERLLERVYTAGVDGVYVCGSSGEGLLLPVSERKRVLEVVRQYSPRGKQIIVHTGAHRTADAVELTRHASSLEVTAVSSLPPLGIYSYAEVRAYYARLSAATQVPFLVYFFPAFTNVIGGISEALDLCTLPNVAGLKYTDHNLYRMSEIARTGAVIFNGYDEVLAAGLLMGACGGIGTFYNLVPELFVSVYRSAREGRWDDARATQTRINELITLAARFSVLPAVKTMLRWNGIACGQCIEPRGSLTSEQEQSLRAAVASSSFAALAAAAHA